MQAVKEAANIAVDTAVKKAEAVKADASAAVEDLSRRLPKRKIMQLILQSLLWNP